MSCIVARIGHILHTGMVFIRHENGGMVSSSMNKCRYAIPFVSSHFQHCCLSLNKMWNEIYYYYFIIVNGIKQKCIKIKAKISRYFCSARILSLPEKISSVGASAALPSFVRQTKRQGVQVFLAHPVYVLAHRKTDGNETLMFRRVNVFCWTTVGRDHLNTEHYTCRQRQSTQAYYNHGMQWRKSLHIPR